MLNDERAPLISHDSAEPTEHLLQAVSSIVFNAILEHVLNNESYA